MGDSYLHLSPTELARIFQPRQTIEISFNRTVAADNSVVSVTVPAAVVNLENNLILMRISREEQSQFPLFRPGRVISIQTGRSAGLLTFKSKILNRAPAAEGLTIGIESPRIMASKERRQGPRIPITLPVVFRVAGFRDLDLKHLADKIAIGESENLSKGGITLLTDLKLPIGLILLMEMTLEKKKITLAGVVRRSQQWQKLDNTYAVGIQFLQPGALNQGLIERTIAKNGEPLKGGLSL